MNKGTNDVMQAMTEDMQRKINNADFSDMWRIFEKAFFYAEKLGWIRQQVQTYLENCTNEELVRWFREVFSPSTRSDGLLAEYNVRQRKVLQQRIIEKTKLIKTVQAFDHIYDSVKYMIERLNSRDELNILDNQLKDLGE